MAETKGKVEDKKAHRAYSRYVKDPVFVGLIVLCLLLGMTTVYFASNTSKVANPTGGAVSGEPTDNSTGTGTGAGTDTGKKVVIYEFSEFLCPYCSAAAGFNSQLEQSFTQKDSTWQPPEPKIRETYGDKVDLQFKHYIIHGDKAEKAAEASECARDQGKFWEMHDIMFENQASLEISDIKSYATQIGLDTTKFNACLDGGQKASVVAADIALAKKLGVTGTPTFFIGGDNGVKIVGAQSFSKFIDPIDKAINGETPVNDAPKAGPGLGTFSSLLLKTGICTENGKPVIELYSTTWCPHCKWIKDTFDSVAKEYVAAGKIVAHHWEIDTGDDTLTAANETKVPDSELAAYKQFNPDGSIPTFVFGCKYYRIGNGYESQNNLTAETNEFRRVIDTLISETAAA